MIVIETARNVVPDVATEMNAINDDLSSNPVSGLTFVGVTIEGKSIKGCGVFWCTPDHSDIFAQRFE